MSILTNGCIKISIPNSATIDHKVINFNHPIGAYIIPCGDNEYFIMLDKTFSKTSSDAKSYDGFSIQSDTFINNIDDAEKNNVEKNGKDSILSKLKNFFNFKS